MERERLRKSCSQKSKLTRSSRTFRKESAMFGDRAAVIDKSALDGSQSEFYIDDNKNSNERIESRPRQNNGVQKSQNANQSISNLQSTGEHDLQLMALRYTSEQPGKLHRLSIKIIWTYQMLTIIQYCSQRRARRKTYSYYKDQCPT